VRSRFIWTVLLFWNAWNRDSRIKYKICVCVCVWKYKMMMQIFDNLCVYHVHVGVSVHRSFIVCDIASKAVVCLLHFVLRIMHEAGIAWCFYMSWCIWRVTCNYSDLVQSWLPFLKLVQAVVGLCLITLEAFTHCACFCYVIVHFSSSLGVCTSTPTLFLDCMMIVICSGGPGQLFYDHLVMVMLIFVLSLGWWN